MKAIAASLRRSAFAVLCLILFDVSAFAQDLLQRLPTDPNIAWGIFPHLVVGGGAIEGLNVIDGYETSIFIQNTLDVPAWTRRTTFDNQGNFGSSAEFVGKTVFHRRLRRPRCSPSLKASLASSAAAPALTLGCAPRCRLVWAMGNGASGGGSGHRV